MDLGSGGETTATPPTIFRFGPFRYDPQRHELRGPSGPVRVGSRALQLLEVLLRNPGRLLDRAELESRVWPDTVVEETSLRVHMSALRRTLGDGRDEARYITNVPGRGYVFVGQVEAMAADAPAPVASGRTAPGPRPLPIHLTQPIGRDQDIARIGELLVAHRLVSIVGAGGMGKTTVALAAAGLQAALHAQGVVFVDLSTLSDATLVVVAVGQSLGLDVARDEPWALLEGLLRDQQVLIVLDNCEHVIEAAAALVERLLRSCPKVRLLTTSREPLEVAAEWVFRLPPLGAPEPRASLGLGDVLAYPAIELFVERAQAASHGFDLTEGNVAAVRQICDFLDGIPLAIELAAARAHSLGVNGLLQRLEGAFELLTRGRRTAMSRHQTLHAVMTWSYELLSETERTVLRRLAVFRSAFTLEEAVEVTTSPELPRRQVIDSVLSLCVRSLAVPEASGADGLPRHRLLYITRLFAGQLLSASPESHATHRRHAVFVRDRMVSSNKANPVLAGFRGGPELVSTIAEAREAIVWALVDENDLMLGIEIVAEAKLVPHLVGMVEEFGQYLSLAIDKARRAGLDDSRLASRLLVAVGLMAGQSLSDREVHRRARAIDRSLADRFDTPAEKIEAFTSLCASAYGRGDYGQVLAHCDEVRSLARDGLEAVGVAIGDRFATFALHALGRHDEAQRTAGRVLQLVADTLESRFQSTVPFTVAMRIRQAVIQWLRGEFQQAWTMVEDLRSHDDREHVYAKCQRLALAAIPIAIWKGDLSTALRWSGELLHHARQASLSYWLAYGMVYTCVLEGRWPEPGSIEARMLEHNVPLMDTVAAIQSRAPHPATLARVRAGAVGWNAPEVLRLAALETLRSDGEDGRARCVAELRDAFSLSAEQGARFWSLRIAISLCEVADSDTERAAHQQVLQSLLGDIDDGSSQPDLQRARLLTGQTAHATPGA